MIEVELALEAHAELGEGPLWDPREQRLWWVDIVRGDLHRFDPRVGSDETFHLGKTVSAVALRQSGGVIVALEHGVASFDATSGQIVMLVPIETGRQDNRLNDGKCDAHGRFWIGSMAYDEKSPSGALYCLDAGHEPKALVTGVAISNGPAWSPDGRLMYYADTPTGRVDVFDFDAATGAVSNRRPFVAPSNTSGKPDGMTVDVEGQLWVALNGAGVCHRYSPQGQLTNEVVFPVKQVSCPTFGGPDLDELFVTTGWNNLTDDERQRQPHAGGVFRARAGVHGQPAQAFLG